MRRTRLHTAWRASEIKKTTIRGDPRKSVAALAFCLLRNFSGDYVFETVERTADKPRRRTR
jgi:hypothetical protein